MRIISLEQAVAATKTLLESDADYKKLCLSFSEHQIFKLLQLNSILLHCTPLINSISALADGVAYNDENLTKPQAMTIASGMKSLESDIILCNALITEHAAVLKDIIEPLRAIVGHLQTAKKALADSFTISDQKASRRSLSCIVSPVRVDSPRHRPTQEPTQRLAHTPRPPAPAITEEDNDRSPAVYDPNSPSVNGMRKS